MLLMASSQFTPALPARTFASKHRRSGRRLATRALMFATEGQGTYRRRLYSVSLRTNSHLFKACVLAGEYQYM